jgi:hypothetical protein
MPPTIPSDLKTQHPFLNTTPSVSVPDKLVATHTAQVKPSTNPSNAHREGSSSFPIPQIQGVVPGFRRRRHHNTHADTCSSHSHAHTRVLFGLCESERQMGVRHALASESGTEERTIKTQTTMRASRSNYPRPSPPCFLSPFPIVPRTGWCVSGNTLTNTGTASTTTISIPTAAAAATSSSTSQVQHTMSANCLHETDTRPLSAVLPPSLKLLFLCTLGTIVLGLTCVVIVFCVNFPPRTWGGGAWRVEDEREREQEREQDQERLSNDQEIEMQTHTMRNTALSSGVELPNLSIHSRRHHERHSLSPQNPFLTPPAARDTHGTMLQYETEEHVSRSSGEWERAHAEFFAQDGDTPVDDTTTTTRYLRDMQALEAGAAVPVPARKRHTRRNGIGMLDRGLDMVDEAVDGVVARVARWTDDADDNEIEKEK